MANDFLEGAQLGSQIYLGGQNLAMKRQDAESQASLQAMQERQMAAHIDLINQQAAQVKDELSHQALEDAAMKEAMQGIQVDKMAEQSAANVATELGQPAPRRSTDTELAIKHLGPLMLTSRHPEKVAATMFNLAKIDQLETQRERGGVATATEIPNSRGAIQVLMPDGKYKMIPAPGLSTIEKDTNAVNKLGGLTPSGPASSAQSPAPVAPRVPVPDTTFGPPPPPGMNVSPPVAPTSVNPDGTLTQSANPPSPYNDITRAWRIKYGLDARATSANTGMPPSVRAKLSQQVEDADQAMEVGLRLLPLIKPETVGAAGFLGRELADTGITQIPGFESLGNANRVEFGVVASQLRSRVVRALKSDPSIAEAERREIEKAVPSIGPRESVFDATQKVNTLRRLSADIVRRNVQRLGEPIPFSAMTPRELKAAYKAGKIDYETAVKLGDQSPYPINQ